MQKYYLNLCEKSVAQEETKMSLFIKRCSFYQIARVTGVVCSRAAAASAWIATTSVTECLTVPTAPTNRAVVSYLS